MNNDKIIIAKNQDKISQCRQGNYIASTGFLNSHEQALAMAEIGHSSDISCLLYGGYDEAERRQLICLPSYISTEDIDEFNELAVLRVEIPKGSRQLTHRDYLGSILGLGIDRSVIGDILVRSESSKYEQQQSGSTTTSSTVCAGADIIIMEEMSGFLLNEYGQIGRSEAVLSVVELNQLIIPALQKSIIKDIVPSLRLDNIISTAFKISRSKAQTAILSGIVSVDHIEQTKPDYRVVEGSCLVLSGKVKAVVSEIGARSKKDRIWISIYRYI